MKVWLKTVISGLVVVLGLVVVGNRLIQSVRLSRASENDEPAFLTGYAGEGNVKKVKNLLARFPSSANAEDKVGYSALHRAAESRNPGCKTVAELLLAKGANVNARNRYGETPLHLAIMHSTKDMVELLLANRADVNAKDIFGNTPLHNAACKGDKDIVELLLKYKADINTKSGFPNPWLASRRVEELTYSYHHPGLTPMDVAWKYHHPDVADYLRIHGGTTTKDWLSLRPTTTEDPDCLALHRAVFYDKSNAMDALLNKGMDPNTRIDDLGSTPLHVAAIQRSKRAAKILLSTKADANAKDIFSHTPLHNAARIGDREIAEMLIAHQASMNEKSDAGLTPLDIAEEFKQPNVADLLRAHGGKSGKELGAGGSGK
jgi:ankyrin repeat protein